MLLFAPVVVQPGGLIYPPRGGFSDLTITHWPNIEFAVESLRAGRLPLWRPTIMSGAPFAANPLAGLFYLPHVIFLVLPLAVGFNVLFIAHLWLTGIGAYVLLRAWQVERPAAFIGALTWMAMPRLFAHLGAGHVGMVESVAWLPLAVLAAHRLAESRRVLDGMWLGAVCAVQFLADPRAAFYSVALSVTYIVWWGIVAWISSPTQVLLHWFSICLRLLAAFVIMAVLSAALWLPFTEFIAQSNRSALTVVEAGEWSLPARQLIGLLLADWGGFHEWMVYVGVLPLVLAVAGSRMHEAGKWKKALASYFLPLASILAALFSLGTNGPLFPLMFRFVPGLALLRVPPRAWFIVAFAAACLCAFGVEVMMRLACRLPGWVALAGSAIAMFAALFGLGGFWVLQNNPHAQSARAAMLHMALVWPASVAVVLLRARRRIGAGVFAMLSAVVIIATLLPVDLSLYRVISESQAFSDHADAAVWLAKQPGIFRIYSPSYSLPQHIAQRMGLELADGVDPMQIASYARFMEAATGAPASGYSVTIPAFPPNVDVRAALRSARLDARLLGKLNVRYIAADFPIQAEGLVERARFGPTFVYENQLVKPRVWVDGGGAARITTNTPGRVVIVADGPGTLTLSQVYYPGWRAVVDGRAVPVRIVDSVLMGVELDSGHHMVELVFAPLLIKIGLPICTVGWCAILVVLLIRLMSFILRRG